VLSATAPFDEDDADLFDSFSIHDPDFVRNYTALRIPASGAGVDFDLPDLHVWLRRDDGTVDQYAVEVKAGRERARFSKRGGDGGIPALRRYGNKTGAIPCAFVHIDYTGNFVVHADDLHEAGKSHSFTKHRDVDEDTLRFEDWVEMPSVIRA
jgi:hypothetical protein